MRTICPPLDSIPPPGSVPPPTTPPPPGSAGGNAGVPPVPGGGTPGGVVSRPVTSPTTNPGTAGEQTSCDPEYMDALEARAWLEAQREITQNQNLIFKPDSVLEYTCFDNFLRTIAGAEMFSESGCCGGPPRPNTMDAALTQVVGTALSAYLTENFPHSFLGGRAGVDYQANPAIGGGAYTCGSMRIAWEAAKNMQFFDQVTIDAFFDFPWYANNDPRQFPPEFAPGTPHPETGASIGVAFNGQQDLYTLTGENPWPFDQNPYEEDPVVTHLDLILPVGVGPAEGCAPPRPTGVCVMRQNMAPYMDAVCPNPGCHYEAPGSGGGGGGGAVECPADPPIGNCVE